MIIYTLIFFCIVIIYFKITSKNYFFKLPPDKLKKAKEDMIISLTAKNLSLKEMSVFKKSFDYFVLYPEKYDGATIVRDLFSLKYIHKGKTYKLGFANMKHDYEYIVKGANRDFIKNWKSNYDYLKDLEKLGKGLYLNRYVGLMLLSIGFVPYNILKNLINKFIKK